MVVIIIGSNSLIENLSKTVVLLLAADLMIKLRLRSARLASVCVNASSCRAWQACPWGQIRPELSIKAGREEAKAEEG